MRRFIKLKRQSKGFVFFEVLIAAMVLSTACLYLSRSLHASLTFARDQRNGYLAALAADRFLWELDRSQSDLRNLNPEAPALKGWGWEVQEEKTLAKGALLRQKIELRWQDPAGREEHGEVIHYAASR